MKILKTVFCLFLLIFSGINSAWAITVSVRVSSSNDDGEEQNPINNTVLRNSTDLEFTYDGGTRQHIGMRFQSLSIPQGATINSAYIEFEVDETDSGTTNVVIYGQDTDDARTLDNGADNISNRTRTTASVSWSIPAWNSVNAKQQTDDISSVIQEIVDRSGWSSGNDLAIIVEPGSGCNSSSCQRTAESYDGEPTNAPLLVIDYTMGGALSCETFRDEFSTESYSRQDGSVNWAGNWIETGDNNAVSNGDIEISVGRLQLEGDGSGGGRAAFGGSPSVEREADLSAYSNATLTFDYSESGSWESNDDIEIWVSSNGGLSWTLLHTFTNDQVASSHTEDLTAYIAADTRIAFVEKANAGNEIFYFDNVQIEACSAGNPTVDTLTTSDTTPLITGTFNSANSAGGFTVSVNSVTYTLGTSAELTNTGDDWTLDLSSATPLTLGLYDVVATSDDGAGNVLVDTTTNELNIIAQVCNATFSDNFSSVSFGNNDGDTNFSGNWDEFEGTSLTIPEASPDPTGGHVQISGGRLVLQNYSPSESPNAPGVEREMDLSGFTSATFSFDFETTGAVDSDDSFMVRVSSNGGTSWTLLENITGIGNTTGSKNYDLTSYISANTKISLRFNTTINSGSCCYGASPETMTIDNINIDAVQPCSTVDHYAINHSGQGITCEAETVTISAHDVAHATIAPSSSTTISLTTSIANDGWALLSGNGVFTTPNQYTFDGVETSVQFWLTKTVATIGPHIDINVTDGSATETSGSANASDDPSLAFVDSLLQFVSDTNSPPATNIATQIGGKPSSTAPNAQNIYLRAVRTDNTTGSPVCIAALDAGTHNIDMGYQCLNTGDCSANEVTVTNNLIYNSGAATTIAHNDGATTGNRTPVTLDFDSSGYAPLSFLYNNVGEIALFAGDYIAASGGTISTGTSEQFIVRPFALTLDFDNGSSTYNMRQLDWNDGPPNETLDGSSADDSYSDPASNPQDSTVFQTAGSSFPAKISGILWQAADDTVDNNGEPDAGANLFNNTAATLFGQGSVPDVVISHALEEPSGANSGTLIFSFPAYVNGSTEGTMNWDEVGIIDIQLTLASFLGDTTYLPSHIAQDVGRFIPARLEVIANSPSFGPECNNIFSYFGQEFSYLIDPALTIKAINANGGTTQNYDSLFWKFNSTLVNRSYSKDGSLLSTTTLSPPTTNGSMAVTDSNNFDGDRIYTITGEKLTATKPAVPESPITNITPLVDLNIPIGDLTDADLVCYDPDNDGNCDSFEISDLSGTELRFGRLSVANSFGSELLPQTVPIRTDYFDGTSLLFVANADDSCTSFDAPLEVNLATASYTTPLALTDLATTGAGTLSSGVGSFILHDNVDPLSGPGVHGDVTYSMAVPAYLQFDWDGVAGDDDPTAKATFGIYSGDSKQIYYRQIYQ